ncbi:glycyl-radical enzyme activating protein [Paludicola sp. MB14-C6]|uniref:glycyl-radical enzyme activating protein n=1 Tax=Paludihabitans sp. MB14-C6 TaxID=3070656 RepID=UPI0027DE0102|nr:glycyl-radical enzyme activating protein [Paludicola sp. MB14-C6]WMJ22331.1 glycyl-radical enzyme activating protein [Paludicola sp. MB14-C6]
MKGCPLRCKWCHNPEGLYKNKQMQYFSEKCIECRKCQEICSCHAFIHGEHIINHNNCKLCQKCINNCPTQALTICGFELTPDEVLKLVLKDKDFYGVDGGVTFSGGEAMLQAEFVVECMKLCKVVGINTTIDTCGYASWELFEKTLPYCDLYLYDIKAFDEGIHRNATGVSNKLILENLINLDKHNKPIWIRIPVIDGVNSTQKEMEYIANFIKPLQNIKKVTLMPYHTLGKSKYKTLGFDYCYNTTKLIENHTLSKYKQIFINNGINID